MSEVFLFYVLSCGYELSCGCVAHLSCWNLFVRFDNTNLLNHFMKIYFI